MKTTKVILFIITIGVLWGIVENVAVLPTNLQTNSFVIWLLNGTSLCTYLILFVISFFLYKLISIYNKMHFFDNKSVVLVRKIAFLVLILAILDVANRGLFDILHNTHLSVSNILKNFFWRTIFVSPTFIFCSILIFILADFMKRAITVKAENESFI
ncbi:MAG: DUF2975 domain-containing protein [Emticicia sp.]